MQIRVSMVWKFPWKKASGPFGRIKVIPLAIQSKDDFPSLFLQVGNPDYQQRPHA